MLPGIFLLQWSRTMHQRHIHRIYCFIVDFCVHLCAQHVHLNRNFNRTKKVLPPQNAIIFYPSPLRFRLLFTSLLSNKKENDLLTCFNAIKSSHDITHNRTKASHFPIFFFFWNFLNRIFGGFQNCMFTRKYDTLFLQLFFISLKAKSEEYVAVNVQDSLSFPFPVFFMCNLIYKMHGKIVEILW